MPSTPPLLVALFSIRLLVVLLTKLPNACAEISFCPGFSDCENPGSAIVAMLSMDATSNFFANILLLLCSLFKARAGPIDGINEL